MTARSPRWPRIGRIVGILVVFQNIAGIGDRLAVTRGLLDHVVLVDNSPGGLFAGRPGLAADDVSVVCNRNAGGLAGGYNAALAAIEAGGESFSHVLFLDDDTDLTMLEAFLTSDATLNSAAAPNIAAVAPAYVDPATNISGAPVRLGRWTFHILERTTSVPTEVSFLINSMSLWKYSAIRTIGRYRVDLGVDHVDTDYCLRALLRGYKLILNAGVRFAHPIGARKPYRFLGLTFQAGGHSAQRRESIARNTILLARQYGRRWPSFAVLCVSRLAYEALGVLAAEPEKRAKISALISGTMNGLFADIEPHDKPAGR